MLVVHRPIEVRHEHRWHAETDDLVERVVTSRADGEIEGSIVAADREAPQPGDARPEVESEVRGEPFSDHRAGDPGPLEYFDRAVDQVDNVVVVACSELDQRGPVIGVQGEFAAAFVAGQDFVRIEQPDRVDDRHFMAVLHRRPGVELGSHIVGLDDEVNVLCRPQTGGVVLLLLPHALPNPYQWTVGPRRHRIDDAGVHDEAIEDHAPDRIPIQDLIECFFEPTVPASDFGLGEGVRREVLGVKAELLNHGERLTHGQEHCAGRIRKASRHCEKPSLT